MRRIIAVCVVAALSAAEPALAAGDPRSPLVGTWRLVSHVDTPEGVAPVRAFGEPPIGQMIFTADGHASIAFMRNPPDPGGAPVPGSACVPTWFCAYFGTYRVDAGRGQWVIHVLGGNVPAYLGTDQTRTFTIEGNRLVISGSYEEDGRRVNVERVFERAGPVGG